MNKLTIYTLLIFALISCGPSQRELAVWKINEGKQLIISGDTIAAIAVLDSIKTLYPKASAQIAVSNNIKDELYRQFIDNKRSELVKTDTLISLLEKNFQKEKTENDKYLQYIHTSQTFNKSWNRSYLGIHLDERGELYLSSNYAGKEQLNHTGIRVYDAEKQAKSEIIPLGDPLNFQSEFSGTKWERVFYMNGKSDSVINFIASNPGLKLKCVFLGNKQYYILLEQFDVKAVCDAYELSNAIKKQKHLKKEIKMLEKKR